MNLLIALATVARAADAAPGEGAPGEGAPAREPLAALEVERGLVLPRGWVEVEGGFARKAATGEWGVNGEAVEWPAGTRWRYDTETIGLRFGVAPRVELHGVIPVHQARLDAASGVITGAGLGDARLGGRVEWIRHRPPTRSLATDLELRLPTGATPAGATVGAPELVAPLAFGTGAPGVVLGVLGRQQAGPFAVTADVSYARALVATSAYAVGTAAPGARFRPGDLLCGGLDLLVQAGPLSLSTRARANGRTSYSLGEAMDGRGDAVEAPSQVPGTSGWSLEVGPRVALDVSRGVQIGFAVSLPVAGGGGALLPLEELAPTRGSTYAVEMAVRR